LRLSYNWGYSNGKLRVGVRRDAVASAIREAEALGFISVNDYGEFGLTYCGQRGMYPDPPNHDWRNIKTMKAAARVATKARTAKRVRRSRRPPDDPVSKPSPPPWWPI
jgi:hypothetical protein